MGFQRQKEIWWWCWLFIRDTISFQLRSDLNDPNIEILTIEITKNKSKPFLLTTWYRPPNDPIDTLYKFENCLKLTDNENKESIILGDVNSDILSSNPSHLVSEMNFITNEMNFITNLYQYEQLINEPTRVTKDNATLIDHFYTTKPDLIISSGVRIITISDHYLIYAVFVNFIQPREPRKLLNIGISSTLMKTIFFLNWNHY